MSGKEDFVEVVVKVPKVVMQLLEDQEFFGMSKDSFLTTVVQQALHIELCELDVDEEIRLEHKYGIEPKLVVNLSGKELGIG